MEFQPDVTASVRPEISVILEDAGTNWSAYAPGIPGVAATGSTPEECRRSMEEALAFHFRGLAEDDLLEAQRERAAQTARSA